MISLKLTSGALRYYTYVHSFMSISECKVVGGMGIILLNDTVRHLPVQLFSGVFLGFLVLLVAFLLCVHLSLYVH